MENRQNESPASIKPSNVMVESGGGSAACASVCCWQPQCRQEHARGGRAVTALRHHGCKQNWTWCAWNFHSPRADPLWCAALPTAAAAISRKEPRICTSAASHALFWSPAVGGVRFRDRKADLFLFHFSFELVKYGTSVTSVNVHYFVIIGDFRFCYLIFSNHSFG